MKKFNLYKQKVIDRDKIQTGKWIDALLLIYNRFPEIYFSATGRGDKEEYDSQLKEDLKIDDFNLMFILSRLYQHGLIENKKSTNGVKYISLTEKGFDIAFELKKQKRDHANNVIMLLFTGMLAFTAFGSFYWGYYQVMKGIMPDATIKFYADILILVSVVFVFSIIFARKRIYANMTNT